MAEKTSMTHSTTFDQIKFKSQLDQKEKETVKNLGEFKLSSLRIPPTYIFPRPVQGFMVGVLKYDSSICEANTLDVSLIGTEIEHLLVCVMKYSPTVIDTSNQFELCNVPDPKSEKVFGYIFDRRNTYINMSHLEEKYSLIFEEWEYYNKALILKYSEASGLKSSELILRGADTYVLPGLCINFICAVMPEYGLLMKAMSNIVTSIPATK